VSIVNRIALLAAICLSAGVAVSAWIGVASLQTSQTSKAAMEGAFNNLFSVVELRDRLRLQKQRLARVVSMVDIDIIDEEVAAFKSELKVVEAVLDELDVGVQGTDFAVDIDEIRDLTRIWIDKGSVLLGLRKSTEVPTQEALSRVEFNLSAKLDSFLENSKTASFDVSQLASDSLVRQIKLAAALGCFFMIAAIAFSTASVRRIRNDIGQLSSAMSCLSNGELDIQVPESGDRAEVGRMAKTVRIFQEELKRGALLEAEREETRKSIEEKNAQTSLALERLKVVVTKGVAGDFTVRMATAGLRDNELELAQSLNLLLETVDVGIGAITDVMKGIADADLTQRMVGDFNGAFSRLQANVCTTCERLSKVIEQTDLVAHSIDTGRSIVEKNGEALTHSGKRQAAALADVSQVITRTALSAQECAQRAQDVLGRAKHAEETADNGREAVQATIAAITEISESSALITDIISLIESIAFQTNLLSLNASVEAARAGSAGAGFTVVASEVRELAKRSKSAADEISILIRESSDKVDNGVKLALQTGGQFDQIVHVTAELTKSMEYISKENTSIERALEQASLRVHTAEELSEVTNSTIKETTATASEFGEHTSAMTALTSSFQTSQNNGQGPEVPHQKIA